MKNKNLRIICLVVCLSLAAACSEVLAGYEIQWSTIDGGGGTSSGGQYSLTGTIGQPDAAWSASGQYELLGGFWSGEPLCMVNFYDYSNFAGWWMDGPCNTANNFCGGADLDGLGDVDAADLEMLAEQWLCNCPVGWRLK